MDWWDNEEYKNRRLDPLDPMFYIEKYKNKTEDELSALYREFAKQYEQNKSDITKGEWDSINYWLVKKSQETYQKNTEIIKRENLIKYGTL